MLFLCGDDGVNQTGADWWLAVLHYMTIVPVIGSQFVVSHKYKP